MEKTKIIIIVGPTATGKSSLAVRLCQDFNGAVINADSVQVYKHLNIGTAKPTLAEMGDVPHYLIDYLDPKEDFSAADFRSAAVKKIAELTASGKNAVVVGGTGLYVKILTQGIIGATGFERKEREELNARAESEGVEALYEELKAVDPDSAERISINDKFRIIRALEVFKATGTPISRVRETHAFKEEEFNTLKIGLRMERPRLYKRIEKRVDSMVEAGLLDEVKSLVHMGYDRGTKPLMSIGYKQMLMFLSGEISYDEAVRLIKRDTKRYAKRQFTWFNKDDGILWHDAEAVTTDDGYDKVKNIVSDFLVT